MPAGVTRANPPLFKVLTIRVEEPSASVIRESPAPKTA